MNKDEIRLMSLELIGDYGKEGAIDACKLAMEEINLEEEEYSFWKLVINYIDRNFDDDSF